LKKKPYAVAKLIRKQHYISCRNCRRNDYNIVCSLRSLFYRKNILYYNGKTEIVTNEEGKRNKYYFKTKQIMTVVVMIMIDW